MYVHPTREFFPVAVRNGSDFYYGSRSRLYQQPDYADYFYGSIPCARALTDEEINGEYEKNTGLVIIETFRDLDPVAVPGVLCKNHGPFAWGKDAHEAVHNAVVLEEVAKMAVHTRDILPDADEAPQALKDKHYFRKHGKDAYYGQN